MNDAAGPWMAVAISTTRRCSKGVDMFFLLLRPPGGPFPRASLQAEFGGVAKDRVCHTNRNGCADRRG